MASKSLSTAILLFACACAAGVVNADDKTAYNARVAARDLALFQALDLNGDGMLARAESRGDLDLGPRFDDFDINRDGFVTQQELQRYIAQRYSVQADAAPAAATPQR